MKQAKQTVKEMIIGMLIWMLAVFLILLAVTEHRLSAACGLLYGGAASVGILLHMYRHLDIALDMDVKGARRHIQVASLQRMLIMGLVLAVSLLKPQFIHPLGTVLGLFGIKIGAFLRPTVHRYLQKGG